MLHTNNPIIKHKAGLLSLASERFYFDLGEHGLNRQLDTFLENFCQPIWISRK